MTLIQKIPLLGLFVASLCGAVNLDRVVAVVGEKPILKSDVVNFQNSLKNSPALAGIYQMKAEEITFEKCLNRMIEEKVIQIAALSLDVRVTDGEVDNQVMSIAKQNNMTRAQLENSLRREGIAMDSYERNIRSQLEKRNVFERELRRGGGTAGEGDLRNLYDKNAPQEYKISLTSFKVPKNPKDRLGIESKVKEISSKLNQKDMTVAEARKNLEAEPLDWLTSDSMNSKILDAIKKINPPAAVGPIKIDNNWTVVVYEENRHGSEEGFQKAKEELSQRLQGQEFERRFDAWLEKKKQELHIVINKQ